MGLYSHTLACVLPPIRHPLPLFPMTNEASWFTIGLLALQLAIERRPLELVEETGQGWEPAAQAKGLVMELEQEGELVREL